MNQVVKKSWIALLLLFLGSNCTQEQRAPERKETALYPYTLGIITIGIPAAWEQKDYIPDSADPHEPYVFMNPAQPQDSLLGDAIMVIVKQRKGKPNLKSIQEQFVESMEVEGENHVQMLSFQDSIFAGRELVLIDFDMRFPAQNLHQVGTYACYYRAGALISIVGLAQRKTREENAQKRALFREVIYSVDWINE